ncbi:MAG: DUF418 domain-containing protein [Oscillibacter sp.]|nr:DUF418 domain-containing protein [Oscillibacter sp.]
MTEQTKHTSIRPAMPVESSARHIILDVLRGLALLGIALANFPEFSLYSFLPETAAGNMPTAAIDRAVHYLQYIFIDGKFYTIFSLLFGIGFSIIISNAMKRGADGFRIFYRRMTVLLLIGFLHLMFIWSGDILMLYALLGMLLPFFRHAANKTLLTTAAVLLVIPIVIDFCIEASGIYPAASVVELQQYYCARYGINEANFAYWLRDADNYGATFQFLIQGALVRIQEFIDGNRYFKVLGLFLIGFYIGRNRLYADLGNRKALLKRIATYGFGIGLPLSVVYAWSAMNGRPWGLGVHALLYFVSIFPLGFAYMAGVSLCFLRHPESSIFRFIAMLGRMALTNYIGQSLWGMLLFYGIGFGMGAGMGLIYVVLIATGVWIVQACLSGVWLHFFRFGLLEWLWRMLTYGKIFQLTKEKKE